MLFFCPYPCLCLCFGFEHRTRTTPLRLIILHLSHIFLTLERTFISYLPIEKHATGGPDNTKPPRPNRRAGQYTHKPGLI